MRRLCRSRAEQLTSDLAYAEQQRAAAEADRDTVGACFWSTLATALRKHVPTSAPTGAVIALRPAEEEPEPDPSEEFIEGLIATVEQLRQSLEPVEVENAERTDDDCAPRKSKQQCEELARGKRADVLSALEELLEVTEDMPEVTLPLPQADIVAHLACTDAVASLVSCITAPEYGTRLQATGAACACLCVAVSGRCQQSCTERSACCRAARALGRRGPRFGGQRGGRKWRQAVHCCHRNASHACQTQGDRSQVGGGIASGHRHLHAEASGRQAAEAALRAQ